MGVKKFVVRGFRDRRLGYSKHNQFFFLIHERTNKMTCAPRTPSQWEMGTYHIGKWGRLHLYVFWKLCWFHNAVVDLFIFTSVTECHVIDI